MAKIIAWIKLHLMVVICSSIGVVSLVLIVLGFVMPNAQAELEADKGLLGNVQGVKPANERVVEDIRSRQRQMRQSVQKFLTEASKTPAHGLLNNDVFPEIRERFAPNVFREKCDQKRRELLAILNAKDKPSQQDIEDYNAELLKAKQKKQLREGGVPAGPGGPAGPAAPGRPTGLDKLTPDQMVKEDARSGASVKRAHEVYCYAAVESLDPRNQITAKDAPVELMWESQLSLWIQEDLIQTLAKLNNEAANALPEGDRWVGNLPIKHLMYITVGAYLPKSTEAAASAGGSLATEVSSPAPPPMSSKAVFTDRGADDKRDVVHLSLGLVIDSSYLVKVIDEISRIGFYTPLSVSYEAVEPNPYFQDYIYGSGPAIRVRLELEHCILRQKMEVDKKKLEDVMPVSIKEGKYVSDPMRMGEKGTAGPGGPGAGPYMQGQPMGPGPGRPGGRRME